MLCSIERHYWKPGNSATYSGAQRSIYLGVNCPICTCHGTCFSDYNNILLPYSEKYYNTYLSSVIQTHVCLKQLELMTEGKT